MVTYYTVPYMHDKSCSVADPGISKRGGRGPGAVEFLGLGLVLMPLHTYSVFVARVVNKIHYVNIVN